MGYFLPFYPLTTRKIKINNNNNNKKKTPGDIIILQKCTKNHDHTLYSSWDMARDGCNCYFLFWPSFSFYPSNSPKDQNFKEMKKTPGDIIILRMRTMIRWCTILEMWCATDGRREGRGKKVTYRGGCPTWKHSSCVEKHSKKI